MALIIAFWSPATICQIAHKCRDGMEGQGLSLQDGCKETIGPMLRRGKREVIKGGSYRQMRCDLLHWHDAKGRMGRQKSGHLLFVFFAQD